MTRKPARIERERRRRRGFQPSVFIEDANDLAVLAFAAATFLTTYGLAHQSHIDIARRRRNDDCHPSLITCKNHQTTNSIGASIKTPAEVQSRQP